MGSQWSIGGLKPLWLVSLHKDGLVKDLGRMRRERRDWSETSVSQEVPKAANYYQKPMESQATVLPWVPAHPQGPALPQAYRGIKSADSVFGLVSSKIVRYTLLFSNNRMVVTMAVYTSSFSNCPHAFWIPDWQTLSLHRSMASEFLIHKLCPCYNMVARIILTGLLRFFYTSPFSGMEGRWGENLCLFFH